MDNDVFEKYQHLGASGVGGPFRDTFLGKGDFEVRWIGYFLLGLSAFLITVSISLIGVANPSMQKKAGLSPVHEVDHLGKEDLAVALPFGARARKNCMSGCKSAACQGACNRLLVGEFARRILLSDPDPAELARETATKCRETKVTGTARAPEKWKENLRQVASQLSALPMHESIYDSRIFDERFRKLEELRMSLANAPDGMKGGHEAAASVAGEICLRESITLSQIAVVQVANVYDAFSERFYRRFEDAMFAELQNSDGALDAALAKAGIKEAR